MKQLNFPTSSKPLRYLLLAACSGLLITSSCSVVPEPEPPQPVARASSHQSVLLATETGYGTSQDVQLGEVIVTGPRERSPGKTELPCGGDCDGTGGEGGGGAAGGGANGGAAGGGSGGGSNGTDPAASYVTASVTQQNPTLGNYGATLRVKDNRWQVIEVQVELDKDNKDLKKVVVTLAGVVWLTKLVQNGDGTLDGYNPTTDTYNFHVSVTKIYGDAFANTRTLYGQISPRTNTGRVYFPD